MSSTEHNMNHMQFLRAVALDDVRVLEVKEGTYQGSWKRAGGTSAWFMLRRNMDRLLSMMEAPTPPPGYSLRDLWDSIAEDPEKSPTIELDVDVVMHLLRSYIAGNIFAAIRHQPGGEDGTVLAVLRDLRRYCLLVEAEMVNRGYLEVDLKKDPEEDPRREKRSRKPVPDGLDKLMAEPDYEDGALYRYDGTSQTFLPAVLGGAEVEFIAPWVVSEAWKDLNVPAVGNVAALFDTYYNLRTAGVYVLEPAVRAPAGAPHQLWISAYNRVVDAESPDKRELDWYILRVGLTRYYPGLRDRFPYVLREMNTYQRETAPEWQRGLYEWHEGQTKWLLRSQFSDWAHD